MLNRIMISSPCLSMISAQTLRVCREGKPVPTFPDHALPDTADARWGLFLDDFVGAKNGFAGRRDGFNGRRSGGWAGRPGLE
jgi:hypothetical protein